MNEPRELRQIEKSAIKYSICTLVTKPDVYQSLVSSFQAKGFGGDDCEFLFADNTGENNYDGFVGVNRFFFFARGDYIILCHQDVLLITDDRTKLDRIIVELDRMDPAWAVFGNAGGISPGRLALRISDPHGVDQKDEKYPIRVHGLDENFVVVRRDANLAVSHDLKGFHFYGADLCIIAEILGRSAYVVDFHLRHLSSGVVDAPFYPLRAAMIKKYSRALKSRWIQTPSTLMFLHSNTILSIIMNMRYVIRLSALIRRYLASSRPAER